MSVIEDTEDARKNYKRALEVIEGPQIFLRLIKEEKFDLIIGISVFTHLKEKLQFQLLNQIFLLLFQLAD